MEELVGHFHSCLLKLIPVELLSSVILFLSAGDSLTDHNDQKFSTFDKDQDVYGNNCAKEFLGAFWYKFCHTANPNGVYLWGEDDTHFGIGVVWSTWKNSFTVSMKSFSMKIKRVS